MDKAKRFLLLFSACAVAVTGALTASHQLSASAEHWVSLAGIAFGGLAHFLPSLLNGAPAQGAQVISLADAKKDVQP